MRGVGPVRQNKSAKLNQKKQTSKQNAPVAKATRYTQGQPRIQYRKNEILIHHTEYLADILGNNTNVFPEFQGPRFAGNIYPCNQQIFPWLSAIANQYESYQFEKLEFEYQPSCGSSTPGVVMMSVDYDSTDDYPSDKVSLMASESAVKTSSWCDVLHRSKNSNLRKQKSLYTDLPIQGEDSGGFPTSTVSRLTAVGKFILAAIGQLTNSTIGELFVHYAIRLITPQLAFAALPKSLGAYLPDPTDIWNGAIVSSGIQAEPANANYLSILQNFQGICIARTRGTDIETYPLINVENGGSSEILMYSIDEDGGRAVSIWFVELKYGSLLRWDTVANPVTVENCNILLVPSSRKAAGFFAKQAP